jgi:hypothetical protein
LIYLSAVLSGSDTLCDWLGVPRNMVFSNPWRPTARRIGIWRQDGRLIWLYGNDPIRPEGKAGTDLIGWKPLFWPQQMYATDKIGQMTSQLKQSYANSAYLVHYLAVILATQYWLYALPVLHRAVSRQRWPIWFQI